MISMIKHITDPYGDRNVFSRLSVVFSIINRIINLLLFPIFKILKIKLLKSPFEAIGHQIYDMECFFYEKNKNNYDFTPLILESPKFISNPFLLSKQKEKFKFFTVKNKFICTILYYQKKFDNVCFNTDPYLATRKNAKAYSILKKTDFKINFSENDIRYCKKILEEKKIKLEEKLVILHVRDDTYKPFDGESYRSSNIENYKLTIKWLKDNGYQIIRIGNKGMVKCSFENLLIDTTQNSFGYSDPILDFYFTSKSRFFISTCSGPEKIAKVFDKPVVSIDMAPLAASLPLSKKCIALPKLVKNTKNEKILSFHDLINYNFADLRLDRDFKKNNLTCISNTSEEILEAVKELHEKIINNDFELNEMQKKFNNLFHKDSYCYGAEATISSSFINRYKHLLIE